MTEDNMGRPTTDDPLTLEEKANLGLVPVADSFWTDENVRLSEGSVMRRAANHVCPRCGGDVPSIEHKGQYPGALSRTDNLTEICSSCGNAEGFEQFGGGRLTSQADWRYPPAPGANAGSGKAHR